MAVNIKTLIKFKSNRAKYLLMWNWSVTVTLLICRYQIENESKIKFTNINFLKKCRDFFKINRIAIIVIKKLNWKISNSCDLFPQEINYLWNQNLYKYNQQLNTREVSNLLLRKLIKLSL